MAENASQERVKWIDVAKFIGIFCIFVWHTGDSAGYSYKFFAMFHVPLFFFLSGCVENYDRENNYLRYVWKNVKSILFPYFFFCFLSLLCEMLCKNDDGMAIISWCKIIVKGTTREWFMAYQLWFLSALFVTKLIFKVLRLVKYKVIMLIVSFAALVVAYNLVDSSLRNLPWNLYWVAFYIVFFAAGYCFYPYIARFFTLDSITKKIPYVVSMILCIGYCYITLFNGDVLSTIVDEGGTAGAFAVFFRTLIIMWAVLCISRLLQEVPLFKRLGKETLWLCGNEFIVKRIVTLFLSWLGLTLSYTSPFVCYIYVVICIAVIDKLLNPIEKKIYYSIGETLRIDPKDLVEVVEELASDDQGESL